MPFRQSIPIPEEREYMFRLSAAGGAPVTGATFSGSEIQIRKAGGSLANAANQGAVAAQGSTGLYVYSLTVSEIDTPGPILLRVNKSGALLIEEKDLVERAQFGTVTSGTLTATAFSSDLTQTEGHWKDALVTFLTGALKGQVKKIGSFASTGGVISLASGLSFTAAPAAGDVFEIVSK